MQPHFAKIVMLPQFFNYNDQISFSQNTAEENCDSLKLQFVKRDWGNIGIGELGIHIRDYKIIIFETCRFLPKLEFSAHLKEKYKYDICCKHLSGPYDYQIK